MSVTITKNDGTSIPMYRGAGEIVIGLDEDYNQLLSLNTASLLAGLERLGFAVIPLED